MPTTLRLLILEDEPQDAELSIAALEEAGYRCRWERVETREGFLSHLEESDYDLILSDYKLPHFDGMAALALVMERKVDIPFILVSGTLGEEEAIKSLKAGAVDYVLKTRLSRLAPVVRRALDEHAEHREHQRVEQELWAERDKLRAVFAAMKDGVYMVDQEYNIEYVNPAFLAEFGPYDGCKCYAYLHDRETVCPWCPNQEVFAGKSVQWEWTSLKNGKTYDLFDTLLTNADGSLSKLEILHDITERKRVEEEKARFLVAIDQTAETIVITDAEGTIQYVNPAFEKMTGYTQEEAMGQNPRILKSGEQGDAFYKAMWQTLAAGQTWSERMVNRKKDGTFYTEEATISPVKDSDGKVVNYVAITSDITGELFRDERVRQTQKMESIGRLAGGVAHDFNNILQTITGFCELILEGVESQSVQRQDVAEIQKAAQYAASLTRQLLTFSREQPVQHAVLDLNTVLSDGEKILRQALDDSFKLDFKPGPRLMPVSADDSQILQIAMNLVVNARDAMPEGGTITLQTQNIEITKKNLSDCPGSTVGMFICFSVADTGCGMDAKQQERIFEPFYSTKQIGKGTGLGLSVVYGIVEEHGGWISVSSKLGKGTVFRICLPVHDAAKSGERRGVTDSDASLGKRILLVEDDPVILDLTAEILQDMGYAVTTAADAREGEQVFIEKNGAFDLLFSDVVLPDGNGIELAGFCTERYPMLPVLLFSGHSDERARVDLIREKGFSYIRKPFNLKKLLDVVARAIPCL